MKWKWNFSHFLFLILVFMCKIFFVFLSQPLCKWGKDSPHCHLFPGLQGLLHIFHSSRRGYTEETRYLFVDPDTRRIRWLWQLWQLTWGHRVLHWSQKIRLYLALHNSVRKKVKVILESLSSENDLLSLSMSPSFGMFTIKAQQSHWKPGSTIGFHMAFRKILRTLVKTPNIQ